MDEYAVFEELYKKYNPIVYYYCYGNEDYMQDVWLEIWKHIRRGTLRSTGAAYMNTAIRQNAHISYYSKNISRLMPTSKPSSKKNGRQPPISPANLKPQKY